MKRTLLLLKVGLINNLHYLVICSSTKFTNLFKRAIKWAQNHPKLDFTIRMLHILTHWVWGFYLSDNASIAAFVWMTWFNISISLYSYMDVKFVVSIIVCGIGSWWIFSWMCIWYTISKIWELDFERRPQELNNQSEGNQEPVGIRNQGRRRYVFYFCYWNLNNLVFLAETIAS